MRLKLFPACLTLVAAFIPAPAVGACAADVSVREEAPACVAVGPFNGFFIDITFFKYVQKELLRLLVVYGSARPREVVKADPEV